MSKAKTCAGQVRAIVMISRYMVNKYGMEQALRLAINQQDKKRRGRPARIIVPGDDIIGMDPPVIKINFIPELFQEDQQDAQHKTQ